MSPTSGWWEDLSARYAVPTRAYHHIGHVGEVLAHWHDVHRDLGWQSPAETWVAVLLHDVVYVPGATDNEERSAQQVVPWTGQFGIQVDCERVESLIRLTAAHGGIGTEQVDPEAALFLDCDMAILGAEPARFERYGDQVRAEYSHLPDDVFQAGRNRFLQGLLDQRIFLSDRFYASHEERARTNIRAALVD